jgi:hypothetical protein
VARLPHHEDMWEKKRTAGVTEERCGHSVTGSMLIGKYNTIVRKRHKSNPSKTNNLTPPNVANLYDVSLENAARHSANPSLTTLLPKTTTAPGMSRIKVFVDLETMQDQTPYSPIR